MARLSFFALLAVAGYASAQTTVTASDFTLAPIPEPTMATTTASAPPSDTSGIVIVLPTHAKSSNSKVKRVNAREFQGFKRSLTYPIDTSNKPIPSGYSQAFSNLQASTQANGTCAAKCNGIQDCQFFNIYYERDPDSNNNPIDNIKCSFYNVPQTSATATNQGQWRGTFEIIITGSNGYSKVPVAPNGYILTPLDAAINAPVYDRTGQWTILAWVDLPEYSPTLCSAACDRQTAADAATAKDVNYKTCVFANLFVLSKNGSPYANRCTLYTQVWNSTYATDSGQYVGNDQITTSSSIGLTNTTAAATYPKLTGAPKTLGHATLASTPGGFGFGFGFYNFLHPRLPRPHLSGPQQRRHLRFLLFSHHRLQIPRWLPLSRRLRILRLRRSNLG